MPQGPTSIKVVSILGIIYAGLGLLAVPCGLFFQFHPMTPNPAIDAMNQDPTYIAVYLGLAFIRLLLGVTLLVGSIASLKLKPYGRKVMLAYAVANIVYMLISLVIGMVIMMPRMEVAFAADPKLAGMAGMVKVLTIVGMVLVLLWYGAVSGVILYFFNRKVAVDAFKGIFPAEPADVPGDYMPQG